MLALGGSCLAPACLRPAQPPACHVPQPTSLYNSSKLLTQKWLAHSILPPTMEGQTVATKESLQHGPPAPFGASARPSCCAQVVRQHVHCSGERTCAWVPVEDLPCRAVALQHRAVHAPVDGAHSCRVATAAGCRHETQQRASKQAQVQVGLVVAPSPALQDDLGRLYLQHVAASSIHVLAVPL